jgi:putative ubiquitin-RnfH superfamily antitoxin RatB of RatAB toxin-antitoxin module
MAEQTTVIAVEVAYATPELQRIKKLDIAPGTTAREAVALSGLEQAFEGADLSGCRLGIFGRLVSDEHVLRAGDRVEIYRPLVNDPREKRRELAQRGETM